MEYERFCEYINQAVGLGFSNFQLTPLTGEVFADKGLMDKLRFLDKHPEVKHYGFFTNLTLADAERLEALFGLEKLTTLDVSIYGHDLDSFTRITQRTAKTYDKLIENLLFLEQHLDRMKFQFQLGWRTEQSFDHWRSSSPDDLTRIIRRFRKAHGVRVRVSREYNNWGGVIQQEDLKGLDIDIRRVSDIYKNGACGLIFGAIMIKADGKVNACACRDVNGTLCIGDLNETPLRHVLSAGNERYVELIKNQQAGRFNDVCHDCDLYKSIYRNRHHSRTITLKQFYREIEKR